MFTRLLSALPGQCLVCQAWPASALCAACVQRFAAAVPRCQTCALPVPEGVTRCGACLRQPPPLHACLAAVSYAWPWTSLIAQWKFTQTPGLAAPLGQLLAAAPGVAHAVASTDLVLPVPLSAQRLAERGYNPAQWLARALAPGKLRIGVLQRTRHTLPQHDLPRAQRLKNVRDAFALAPSAAALLHHRRVVLIDDVMTTGATLHAAALPLLAAGAAQVTGIVLARAEPAGMPAPSQSLPCSTSSLSSPKSPPTPAT
ncbi:MAG: phosphoribosyltransferase family protein [Pseudomonadota bacterium]|nr:phosphoribosyltransferase family protein [Pseudomonadota bacterium]